MEMSKKSIQIDTEYITLGQFLKLANLISTGGEAKTFLLHTKIVVDGENENRRGKKLYPGSEIEVDNKSFVVSKK